MCTKDELPYDEILFEYPYQIRQIDVNTCIYLIDKKVTSNQFLAPLYLIFCSSIQDFLPINTARDPEVRPFTSQSVFCFSLRVINFVLLTLNLIITLIATVID